MASVVKYKDKWRVFFFCRKLKKIEIICNKARSECLYKEHRIERVCKIFLFRYDLWRIA